MRPLCGAIITAGALIGLGLYSIGYGTRYAAFAERNTDGHLRDDYWVKISQMDTSLVVMLALLVITLGIGLAIAFVGLAYHHLKRQQELEIHHTRTVAPSDAFEAHGS